MKGSKKTDIFQMGRGSRDGMGRKGDEKRSEMCYAHVPTFHKECDHYVLQTCTNKKRKKSNIQSDISSLKNIK